MVLLQVFLVQSLWHKGPELVRPVPFHFASNCDGLSGSDFFLNRGAGDGACFVEEWAVSAISCLVAILETSFFGMCALSRHGSLS